MNKKYYGWYVVFMNAFIGCVLSAGFPQSSMTAQYLAERMQVSQEAILMGDTIKTIGIIVSMLISGVVYKKIGAKKTFLLGMAAVIIPLAMTPYIKSIVLLYVLKFFQGLASIIFPIFLLIIMGWIDEKNRGLSTAVFNGVFYGGAGIGGTFSGYVIASFGWVESYWALAALQLVTAVIWIFTVKENPKTNGAGEETTGAVSFGDMLKMPIVWYLVFGFLATTWCVQAISVDMPLFGSFLGYGEMETGKIMSAITIGIVASCIISGKASDVFAQRSKSKAMARVYVLMVGSIIIVGAVGMILTLDLTNFTVFYMAVFGFSFGAAWGLGAFYSILPELFDGETLPVATGITGGFGDAGMTFAPVVVGIVFGVKGFWNIGWGLCAVVAGLSVVACMLMIRSISKVQR